VREMFDRIAPRYDLVNRVMTFGMDPAWRRRATGSLSLPAGSTVVDVACGTGDFCRELARHGHRAVGVDFAWEMLKRADAPAPLVQADALRLPLRDQSVDGVTCGFALRNVTDIARLVQGFVRVLRRGGRVSILEVAQPRSRVLQAGHSLYFRKLVPVIGGLLSDEAAYRYLPESTAYLPPTAELEAMLARAGFTDVRSELLMLGAVQILSGTKR